MNATVQIPMNSLKILQKGWKSKLELSLFHPVVGNFTNRFKNATNKTNYPQIHNHLMEALEFSALARCPVF